MRQYNNYLEKIELIKNGGMSLEQNVKDFLRNIDNNKNLNAFNFIFEESIEQAKLIEEKIKAGTAGKAAGLVVAIKDNIAIKDKPLTCSSKILNNFNSIYNADVVERLINEDAIIIGKTNCDEFAMGSSNENSAFGIEIGRAHV